MTKTAAVIGSALSLFGCAELSTEHAERQQTLERGRTTITLLDLDVGAASSVNASGDVVGTAAGVPPRSFVWRNGVRTELAVVGDSDGSHVTVINDTGLIGGYHVYETLGGTSWGQSRPTIWNTPVIPMLVDEPMKTNHIMRINSAGQAIAVRADAFLLDLQAMRDFFWSASTGALSLPDLGGGATDALDLNESGTVVGVSATIPGDNASGRAFSWTLAGGIHELGTLGGLAMARAVNDRDVVVGASWIGTVSKPVKWAGGVLQQLDSADGMAIDVNNSGNAVGWRMVDGHRHATLWRDGVAIDLGAGPGTEALRINDLDIVVGDGANGPFVWTNPAEGPVALPSLSGQTWINRPNGAYTAGNFVAGWSRTDAGAMHAVRWEVQVTPLSDDGPIGDLQTTVDTLEQDGAINQGEANSLDAKLEGALMQCERGNETAARNQIEAFINHVRALIRSGRISASDGEALVAEAEAILASLDCTP